ncbi:MAG: tetratricopeptide repeat protein, partial [Pseudomonadota bacterium]
ALDRARAMMQAGDALGAYAITKAARQAHPGDAPLADAAGDLALKLGDAASAAVHFGDAAQAEPGNADYACNHAIALQKLGRHAQAIESLAACEEAGRSNPRYARLRAASERALSRPAEAAAWYDTALRLEPRNPRALHGLARVALERGEADALARFDEALAVNSGDADLWLGKAQALDVAGDTKGARIIAEQVTAQAPGFIAALEFLSGLKLAAGEADFTSPFADAAKRAPLDPNIPAAHAETLAGLDHAKQAAEVAAAARDRFPGEPHFALIEAIHVGAAGEWERAEAIFATLPTKTPMRALHEARHRLRENDPQAANLLLDEALRHNAWDISAWALRGIAWRMAGDEQAHWLHEQAGLVQLRPLNGREGLVHDAIGELRALHEGCAMPLGQSLRGGTQTRAILFHRTEPLLAELHQAILATLEDYRADLSPHDKTHPLLRHSQSPWQLAGSWSVRLAGGASAQGGDYHTAHIHPQGIVSSALYLVVPEEAHGPGQHGWLEVGRPPLDLGLSLDPVRVIEPQVGHLALFPSTLYHGTTKFGGAERMTVAFDVVPTHGDQR